MRELRSVVLLGLALFTIQSELSTALTPALPDAGSPLYEAIKQRNRAEALRLIRERNGINDVSQSGSTPLFQAIWQKDDELVTELLANGANLDQISRNGTSALNLAASAGSYTLVKKFHELGGDPNSEKAGQHSALWSALCGSSATTDEHWRLVEYLIPLTILSKEKGPTLTCLYCASARAPVRIIKSLIDHGAPIPTTNSLGPILFQANDIEVMRVLVERGADVLAVDRWKRNLLHWTGSSNVEITKFLLDRGVKLNDRDEQGQVPLFTAIRNPDTTITELMLERGADINVVDNDGASVLFYAAMPPNVASASFLLKRGLDPKARNKRDETPIHTALSFFNDVRSERSQLTQLLLQNGTDANAKDLNGTAALHIAASKLDKSALEVLLKHGADPNVINRSGRTPLHMAAGVKVYPQRPTVSGAPQPSGVDNSFVAEQLSRKHDAIRILLRYGANKAIRDISNLRPVDLVLGTDLENTTRLLLE